VTVVESGWTRRPGYRIEITPLGQRARVWFGNLLLADSDGCLLLEEQDHVDRLYFPASDVRWEHFTAAKGVHTVCSYKGQADYWDLSAVDSVETNLAWAYPDPFEQVGGIKGYVCFYHDRARVEVDEPWPNDPPGYRRTRLFPAWGDAGDLVGLMDVRPVGDAPFVARPYDSPLRNVIDGGQLLGEAIVAACKTVPGQRVTSAFMTFSKAVSSERLQDLTVSVLRSGRTFSTVEVRVHQDETFRSGALLLLGADAPDTIRGAAPMCEAPGPDDAQFLDMGVAGREVRIVDGAYDPDPDRIGPPEILAWCRFRDDPGAQYLRAALLAHSTTHWTIAAAMRPHPGFGEARAHVDLSTGVMSCAIAFHDEVDVRDWLLYTNPSIYAGRGLAQGEGRVYTQEGRLVASYSCQVMIRSFERAPGEMGLDHSNTL
jgi:acyl-CoA thioesterase II